MTDANKVDSPSEDPSEVGDSIMSRKRQHKGLSSSFSMNLGRRVSPPHPIRTRPDAAPGTGTGRSVKSIVAWIEASPSIGTPSKVTRSSASRSNLSETSSPDINLQLQRNVGAADVEEYSLTLLKYRKYFTERPLGRCLDEEADHAQNLDLTEEHNSDESLVRFALRDEKNLTLTCKKTPKPRCCISTTGLAATESTQEPAFLKKEPCFIQRDPKEIETF